MHSDPPQPSTPSVDIQSVSNPLLQELPQKYELIGKISQGGMGSIYKAKNRYTGALVAIKVIRPEQTKHIDAMLRFKFEAKAAQSLKHPNICCVHDFDVTQSGLPYLAMEWIDGISLAKKVLRDGKLSVAEAVSIFQQIAMALAHAHQHKVIHRDLKPENIMLTRDPEGRNHVYIVDFGIAKRLYDGDENETPSDAGLTRTGIIVGTPMYMSPEQARGLQLDRRCDIYSLGCLMYFALTGLPPFLGTTIIDTINMHLNDPPPDISPSLKIPADLKLIILRSLEKNPDDRYQSMDEVSTDLKKLTKGVSLERKALASERKITRKRLVIAACFILGFIATYALSIAFQNVLDTSRGHSSSGPELSAPASSTQSANETKAK